MNASHNPTDAREFRIIPRWIMAAMLAVNVSSAEAAVPEIRNVSLRGLQTGATTTIVIDGTDLWPSPRLVMAIPIAHQHALPSSTATRLEIEVTLDAETQPGLYNLWLASAQGISNPVGSAVDGLPERAFTLNRCQWRCMERLAAVRNCGRRSVAKQVSQLCAKSKLSDWVASYVLSCISTTLVTNI